MDVVWSDYDFRLTSMVSFRVHLDFSWFHPNVNGFPSNLTRITRLYSI